MEWFGAWELWLFFLINVCVCHLMTVQSCAHWLYCAISHVYGWMCDMSDCKRLRRAGPLMSPSINLQHAFQSKNRHSVIMEKPQHTDPYINTLFSEPCQNKGCMGRKKQGFSVAFSPTLLLFLSRFIFGWSCTILTMIHEDELKEVTSFCVRVCLKAESNIRKLKIRAQPCQ